ncbi:unnamed protein product, partial [Allacma fusca]
MVLTRVQAALDSIGLADLYLRKFIEHEIDDETVEECFSDTTLTTHLKGIIPVLGHHIKFQKAFRALPAGSTAIHTGQLTSSVPGHSLQYSKVASSQRKLDSASHAAKMEID